MSIVSAYSMIPAIAENTDALFDKITLSQVEKLDLFSKQYEIKGLAHVLTL